MSDASTSVRRHLVKALSTLAVSASIGVAQSPVRPAPKLTQDGTATPAPTLAPAPKSSARIVGVSPASDPGKKVVVQPQIIETIVEASAEQTSFGGSLLERSKLTGDWGGLRTSMAESGITFDASFTQFSQGVSSGGKDHESEYGIKGDYLLNIDGTKLGIWKGGLLTMRAETHLGQSVNSGVGSLLPVNLPMLLPDRDDITAITGLQFTQFLSETFGVYAGKINTLDGDNNAFAHGRGLTQFMNTAFCFNPALARAIPYAALGAGFVVLKDKEPIFNCTVLNPVESSTTTGFDDFFDRGALLTAELRIPTNFRDMPGHQLIGAVYSTRTYIALEPSNYVNFPSPVGLTTQSGTTAIYYNFDQYLVVDSCNPKQGWGVFGRAAITDHQANPFTFFLSAGIGGNSPLRGRGADTFGIGYYYVGVTDNVKLLPFALGDEHGVELYYNIAVTPWCHITPDLQFIDTSNQAFNTAVVWGLRAKVDF